MTEQHFRFAPEILQRLGEELNPHPDQGVVELVRNAYDANARTCTVNLTGTTRLGGSIRVTDDGDGMDEGDIAGGWLVLGRSSKDPTRRTRLQRLQVGQKGLGRLAALRLGDIARLRTRPRDVPGREYELVLDWSRFAGAETIDEVGLPVTSRTGSFPSPGTDIEIDDLNVRLTRRDVKRLARALLLLADPFQADKGFRAVLEAEDFRDLEELVEHGYFEYAQYEIDARLDGDGRGHARLVDHVSGLEVDVGHRALIAQSRHDAERASYSAPAASFHLWVFNLAAGLAGRTAAASKTGLRDWLEVLGGVHVYHRGLRVHPYGDPGHDWLDMNLRRVRSPEERPSTNNSIGQVIVDDPRNQLRQKTDRSGFIEDDAFVELRYFGQDVLDWAATTRLEHAEKRRRRERERAPQNLQRAQTRLLERTKAIPGPEGVKLRRDAQAVERAVTRELKTARDDLLLYRTLGTIGTTTAFVAHEAFNPTNVILRMARSIETRGRAALNGRYDELLDQPVTIIMRSAERLRTISLLPRRLLAVDKRRPRTFDLHAALRETVEIFEPLLVERNVDLTLAFDDGRPRITGTVAALESVLGNLFVNALAAFDRAPEGNRALTVRTSMEDESVVISVLDSGPGIDLPLDAIWLPGRSSTDGGTGLGLTIVRDAVDDLDGEVSAVASGILGGAEFHIELPLATQPQRA